MWAVRYNFPEEVETHFTIWASELEAQKACCGDILLVIERYWDMFDRADALAAKQFNDLVKSGSYKEAIVFWNNCPENCNYDSRAQYFTVLEMDVQRSTSIIPFDDSYFSALVEEEEEEGGCGHEGCDGCDHIDCDGEKSVTTTSGAKCCKCGEYNEYAYATKDDGTYECYSCKN